MTDFYFQLALYPFRDVPCDKSALLTEEKLMRAFWDFVECDVWAGTPSQQVSNGLQDECLIKL